MGPTGGISLIVSMLFSFVLTILMFRFVLSLLRLGGKDQVSQGIFSLTDIVVQPAKKFLPEINGIDMSVLGLILIGELIEIFLVNLLNGHGLIGFGAWIIFSIAEVVKLLINTFFYAILLESIFSWIPQMKGHPIGQLLRSIAAPVLKPLQKLLPPYKGFDFTPLAALLGLKVVSWIFVGTLSAIGAGLL